MSETQLATQEVAPLALSFSGLKDLQVSPMRYWARHLDPDRVIEPTPMQRIGSALHCAVLEPDQFKRRYIRAFDRTAYPNALDTIADIRGYLIDKGVTPKGTKKDDLIVQAKAAMTFIGDYRQFMSEAQEEYEAAIARDKLEVLTHAEWEAVSRMADAVRSNHHVRDLMSGGAAEVAREVDYNGPTGVPAKDTARTWKLPRLRGKIDYATPSYNIDLKTFHHRSKSFDAAIVDTIYYERYHIQGAFYRHLGDSQPEQWTHYCVFVENSAPWEVRVVKLVRKRGAQMTLYWHSAEMEIERCARVFSEYAERFGRAPWIADEPIRELRDEDMKQLAWEVYEQ